jgi:chromosome partitioning protein
MGIDYLRRSVDTLVRDYNEYASLVGGPQVDNISPSILGVVFTMVQFYSGGPITAHQQYISQTKQLGLTVFDEYVRENKSVFSDAPEYGAPVVLNHYTNPTFQNIVGELEALATEFVRRGQIQRAARTP